MALQFKRAYPENFKAYRAACAADEVRLGHMFVFATGQLQPPSFIVNFRPSGTGSRARGSPTRVSGLGVALLQEPTPEVIAGLRNG